ncbi:MAG: acyltransferase [Pseudomonadota bacterium]
MDTEPKTHTPHKAGDCVGQFGGLPREFSIYLDFLRIVAALLVVAEHMENDGFALHLGVFAELGHEAVIIFFVLSGFIIYQTTAFRSRDPKSYAIARLSRVYSVAIPCVILSYLLAYGAFALGVIPKAAITPEPQGLGFALFSTFAFLNQSWDNHVRVPLNLPYWSLNYEVWYYLFFGLIIFTRGWRRLCLFAVAAVASGPGILALFPVWLMGALYARLRSKLAVNLSIISALILFGGSLMLIAGLGTFEFDERLGSYLHARVPGYWMLGQSQRVLTDMLLGVAIVGHLMAMNRLSLPLRSLLIFMAKPIRFFAGASFTTYLLHRPLSQCFSAVLQEHADNELVTAATLIALIFICMAVAEVTERRLGWWRRHISRLFLTSGDRRKTRSAAGLNSQQ